MDARTGNTEKWLRDHFFDASSVIEMGYVHRGLGDVEDSSDIGGGQGRRDRISMELSVVV